MIGLRTIILAAALAAAPFAATAQAANPLAGIDRELDRHCGRLAKASGPEAVKLRARLADLWRDRVVVLAALPRERAAAVSSASGISRRCLLLAQKAAGPSKPAQKVIRRYKRKATKNGAGSGGVIMREAPDISHDDGGVRSRFRDTSRPTPVPAPNGSAAKISRAPASAAPRPKVIPGLAPSVPPNVGPPAIDSEVVPNATASPPTAVLEEFFPWPPPAPSDRRLLELAQLGGDTPPKTWGDVSDRLIRLMRDGDYPTWGFYSAPGGFAVIPHIEQLDDQSGKALAGDARWATEVKLASLGFFQRFATVQLPKGVYRSLIFVLTTDPTTAGEITDAKRALERAKRWATSGALDLPEVLRREKIAGNQRFFILLYEFETEVGGKTKVNASARWRIERHLTDAGIALQP